MKIKLLSFALLALSVSSFAQRNCGSTLVMQVEKQKNPNAQKQMDQNQAIINEWIKNNANKTQSIITIPVVVHVLYTDATMNADVSDAVVKSQIDILNKDYSATNSDYLTVGPSFNNIKGSPNIQFCFATKDPKGNATTGITRTKTTLAACDIADEKCKFTAQGGHDIWAPSKYMNIWVCPAIQYTYGTQVQSGIQGYTQFPNQAGKDSTTDGVMITYQAFGTPTKVYPYPMAFFNKGRTTTHEVGHWLNLHHIWGDSPTDVCTDDDGIADTPVQLGPDYGDFNTGDCPPLGTASCNNGGDFWMDYMNYATDKCEVAFSKGQGAAMQATLNTLRKSLLTATGCGSSVAVADLKPLENNLNVYPNPTTGQLFADVNFYKTTNLSITVVNVIGETVMQSQYNNTMGGSFTLDLSHQQNGIYFVVLKSADETVTRRIVLNR